MSCPIRSALVAPTVRSFSAELDPLGLVARFPDCYPGLLESGAAAATAGRAAYDILPIRSGESLRLGRDGSVAGPHAHAGGGFLDALERWWTTLRSQHVPGALPFSGGWFVYLGYEIASEIESRLGLPPGGDPIVALALRTPAAWIRDRASRRAWLVAEAGSEYLLDRFEAHVQSQGAAVIGAPSPLVLVEDDPEDFLSAVCGALDYIAAGDVYQANLSRRWRGESLLRIDPAAVHARLR